MTANEHHVAGDAARINQVFWNLLKNAIKFTPAGGQVTVRTANPTPGQLVLTVSDNGIGIDQQTLPFVFRALSRAISEDCSLAAAWALACRFLKQLSSSTVELFV